MQKRSTWTKQKKGAKVHERTESGTKSTFINLIVLIPHKFNCIQGFPWIQLRDFNTIIHIPRDLFYIYIMNLHIL